MTVVLIEVGVDGLDDPVVTKDASVTTINITSATPAWYTGSVTLATDDMAETDGWISDGGSRKTLTIEHRATSGNCITYGVSIGEA